LKKSAEYYLISPVGAAQRAIAPIPINQTPLSGTDSTFTEQQQIRPLFALLEISRPKFPATAPESATP
jgi:hypothetical protein